MLFLNDFVCCDVNIVSCRYNDKKQENKSQITKFYFITRQNNNFIDLY